MRIMPVAVLTLLAAALTASAPAPHGEILWDSFGVPHIYADTEEGGFYGFGYAQAQSHGDLLIHLMGEARARAAEYWGEEFAAQDRWLVANDVPQRSAQWYRQQSPQMRRDLDAFAAGINAYAAAHRDRLDPKVLAVLPVTGLDVMAHAHRLMNYIYIASEAKVLSAGLGPGEGEGQDPRTDQGSNAWAVGPARSASGHALLLQNPHLPWAPSQLTYYEAQIETPTLKLYGATQVGLPVIRFGFNDSHGFTNTVNTILGFTSYKLTLAEGGYRFDGRVRPFRTVAKSFRVRQADGSLKTVSFTQRYAVQGPVFDLPNGGGAIALKVAGLDRPGALQQYLDMAKANDFATFQTVLRRMQVSMFNMVYADRDGHILYFDNGILPRHPDGDYATWARAVAGDTSATLWTDIHGYDDLPKVIDPASGFVQNANDPPWVSTWPRVLDPAQYPAYVSVVGPMSQRAQMSARLLSEGPKIDFDDFVARKVTTRSLMADWMLPDLLAAAKGSADPDVQAAVALLSGWDHRFEADSRAALLFETWASIFAGPNFLRQDNYAVRWSLAEALNSPRGLKDPAAAVAMLKEAVAKTRALYGAIDRTYGEVSRLHLRDVNLPANGGMGNLGIFRTLTWGSLQNGEHTPVAGETWVSLIEFSNPIRAVGAMSYGNSTQPWSPHRADQLRFVASKTFRTLWITRAAQEANLEERVGF